MATELVIIFTLIELLAARKEDSLIFTTVGSTVVYAGVSMIKTFKR